MSNQFFQADTKGLDDLRKKLEALPEKSRRWLTGKILRDIMKKTGARKDLQSYINSHIGKRTGIYAKSVSTERTAKVRNNPNRIVGYIHFLPVSKIKSAGSAGKNHMANKTLTLWLDQGTRTHSVGRGSVMGGGSTAQHLKDRRDRAAQRIANLREKVSKERSRKTPNPKTINKLRYSLSKAQQSLDNTMDRLRRMGRQTGHKVRGITAKNFMEPIQQKVDQQAPALLEKQMQDEIAAYLNRHGLT